MIDRGDLATETNIETLGINQKNNTESYRTCKTCNSSNRNA